MGNLVQIDAAPARAKYASGQRITVEAVASRFMLQIYLSTPGQQLPPDEPRDLTAFGALYFRMTEPRRWGGTMREPST